MGGLTDRHLLTKIKLVETCSVSGVGVQAVKSESTRLAIFSPEDLVLFLKDLRFYLDLTSILSRPEGSLTVFMAFWQAWKLLTHLMTLN